MFCAKVSYPNKKAAITARNRRQSEDRGLELKVYFCERCGGWHLAKREVDSYKPTRAQKARERRKGKNRVHLPVRLWKEELADE